MSHQLTAATPSEYNEFLEDYEGKELAKQRNFRASMYLALIAQGTLMQPSRNRQLRGLTLDLLFDYLQYGVNPKDVRMFEKQDAFLSYVVSKHFRIDLPNATRGHKPFLDQVARYTSLHDHFRGKQLSQRAADLEGEIFILNIEASLTISHRTIAALYPHMLEDSIFLEKAVGKELSYSTTLIATFSPDNKIVSLVASGAVAEAWCSLMQDAILTEKVMRQMNIAESYCIKKSTGSGQSYGRFIYSCVMSCWMVGKIDGSQPNSRSLAVHESKSKAIVVVVVELGGGNFGYL